MLSVLYISKLSSKITPTDLATLFKQVGAVESERIITDYHAGELR